MSPSTQTLFDHLRKFNSYAIQPIVHFGYQYPQVRIRKDGLAYIRRIFSIDYFIEKEIFEQNIYHVSVNTNDVVLDVGAEVGYFSLYAASKGANVIAFEPDPRNIRVFNANMALNPDLSDKVELIPHVVFSYDGYIDFHCSDNFSNNSVYAYDHHPTTRMKCITLDDYLPCDILKIDVEGSEYDILTDHVLSGIKKELALEFHLHRNLGRKLPRLISNIKKSFQIDYFKSFQLNGYLHAKRVA